MSLKLHDQGLDTCSAGHQNQFPFVIRISASMLDLHESLPLHHRIDRQMAYNQAHECFLAACVSKS